MNNFLKIELPARYQDYGLLVLRLAFGFAMVYGHGWGKIDRLFGADEVRFADPFGLGPAFSLGLAIFAEVFCALLVMAGLFTRAALIPLIITMDTAFFAVHLNDPFAQQEKAFLFGFAFIALFLTGPGRISLDSMMQHHKGKKEKVTVG